MGRISIVAKRLKEARLLAGISQKKLGIKAGIDEFTASARINQYEKGAHMPNAHAFGACDESAGPVFLLRGHGTRTTHCGFWDLG
jgi:DNA-binding XRE family transcriptional regulator